MMYPPPGYVSQRIERLDEQVMEAVSVCEGIYNDPKGNDGYDAYYTRPYLDCAASIRSLKSKQ